MDLGGQEQLTVPTRYAYYAQATFSLSLVSTDRKSRPVDARSLTRKLGTWVLWAISVATGPGGCIERTIALIVAWRLGLRPEWLGVLDLGVCPAETLRRLAIGLLSAKCAVRSLGTKLEPLL